MPVPPTKAPNKAALSAKNLRVLESLRRCPKFSGCSAPLCPLDPLHPTRAMLPNERMCLWMLEAVKEDPQLPEDIAPEVLAAVQTMPSLVGRGVLRSRLAAAALTGSRVQRGKNFHTKAEEAQA